jgi:predicted dehydrogenase
MVDAVRVALLGYGLAGRWFHAPLLKATDGMRVDAVVTSSPQRAAEAEHDLDGVRVLADAEEVFADPDAFDLVVVATANVAHVPQTLRALERGLHVVVDKPVAVTVAEFDLLAAAAAAADRQLMVFQNRRWDGDFRTLLDALNEGRLGRVHRFESRFERWRPDRGAGWRESPAPEQHGGVLLDLGAHLVDQALLALGPAESVYAERQDVRPGSGSDDDAFIAITHRGGAISHLWLSAVAAEQGHRFRVLGSEGAFVVDGLDPQEQALRSGAIPAPGWCVETRRAQLFDRAGAAQEIPIGLGDWAAFYRGARDACLGKSPAPVGAGSVRESVAVLEAAIQSARDGVVIRMS